MMQSNSQNNSSLFGSALALVLLCLADFSGAEESVSKATAADKATLERGRYIVTTSGCNDCHTPFIMGPNGPEPDMSRMLSGHPQSMVMPPVPVLPAGPWILLASDTNTAWSGPWGISYTANLTPDEDTGLGKWTLRTFIDTIRTGRHQGRGREILPPMPYQMYKHFTDADMEAVFSYLQSIPAVKNKVPEPVLAGAAAAGEMQSAIQ